MIDGAMGQGSGKEASNAGRSQVLLKLFCHRIFAKTA